MLYFTFLRDKKIKLNKAFEHVNARDYFEYKIKSYILVAHLVTNKISVVKQPGQFFDRADHNKTNTITICLGTPHASTFHLAHRIF